MSKNIEYDLSGNHLIANSKALIVVGLYFDNSFSNKFLLKDLKILNNELNNQILNDGSHYELSPMYHSIILEDLLDLIFFSNIFKHKINSKIQNNWKKIVKKMFCWLDNMTFDNQEISFFNDTCYNIAPNFNDLSEYAFNLNISYNSNLLNNDKYCNYLKESGFVNIKNNNVRLIANLGNIEANHIPGHSHADTLSFEMSFYKKKLFVNSGISTYNEGKLRHIQRSTISHNTLTINNKNSSDVWKSFRVGNRAIVFDINIDANIQNEHIFISAKHNGFASLFNKINHKREFILDTNSLEIKDFISGSFLSSTIRYYFHPDVKIIDNKYLDFYGKILQFEINGGIFEIIKTRWYPEFGKSVLNYCLKIDVYENKSNLKILW